MPRSASWWTASSWPWTAGLKRAWVPERVLVRRAGAEALARAPGVAAADRLGAALACASIRATWDSARARGHALVAAGVRVEESSPLEEDVFLAVVRRGAGATA